MSPDTGPRYAARPARWRRWAQALKDHFGPDW